MDSEHLALGLRPDSQSLMSVRVSDVAAVEVDGNYVKQDWVWRIGVWVFTSPSIDCSSYQDVELPPLE
jgi:hypothetical protein